jgi:dTDP-3-amino-3,4,6-trideoxy-alpha-D-glucose transaminase
MAVEHAGDARVRPSVPFVDLQLVHAGLREELLADFAELIDSGAFSNGPAVAEFERELAAYCGSSTSVGVASGLDALRLGLLAAGLEPGDEAIVPANTFIATVEAIAQAGARPVLVDASEADYNIDLSAAAAAVTARTRFLVPVHLYGQLADMRAALALAGSDDIVVIEDACQAHGATRDGLTAGATGAVGAFSFYPAKNLGAFGDAGAAVTSDEQLAGRIRVLREHGQRIKYEHEVEGYTSRLDTIQALVLLRKLPLLDGWNAARRAAARVYGERLSGIGDLVLPPVPVGSDPVWHLYPVRTGRRAALGEFLAARGIATGRHYPQPVHLSPAYAQLGYARGAFPVSEALGDELLSLPIFPGISDEQLDAVVDAISSFFRGG